MISRALQAEILRLHQAEDWPIGTIARQLRVHHDTVCRVLAQAGMPPPRAVRASMVEPYSTFIAETLARYPTLRASRLYAMVRARGYPGGPDHFRAIVARLRPRAPAEAYSRGCVPCPGNRRRSTGRISGALPSAAPCVR